MEDVLVAKNVAIGQNQERPAVPVLENTRAATPASSFRQARSNSRNVSLSSGSWVDVTLCIDGEAIPYQIFARPV